MTEKEKTAYHEAGHCYRAFTDSVIAFRSVCIHQDEHNPDQWWGETTFKRSWVAVPARACTAVAGVIAEAKAVASEHEPRNVNWNMAMRDRILELIQEELLKPEDQQLENVWPLNVPVAGAAPVQANITRPDLDEIPPAHRTEAGIQAALEAAVEMVNNPIHWAAIKDIAAELNAFAPKCLKAFRVYQIIRDAIEEYLEAEDEE